MAEKKNDNQLITTLLIEIAVAGLISLGGFSTLFPNLIESIAEGIQMEPFKTLNSFTLVYTVLPIAIFTSFWFLKGSTIKQNENQIYSYNHFFNQYSPLKWLIILLKFSPILLFMFSDFYLVNHKFLIGIGAFGLVIIFVQRKYIHWVRYNHQYQNITKKQIIKGSEFQQNLDTLEMYDSIIYTMDAVYIIGIIICFRPWYLYSSIVFFFFVGYLTLAGLVSFISWWYIKSIFTKNLSNDTTFKMRRSIQIILYINLSLFLIGFINYPSRPELIVTLLIIVFTWIIVLLAIYRFHFKLLFTEANYLLGLIVFLIVGCCTIYLGQFNQNEGYQNSIRKTFIQERIEAKNQLDKQTLLFPKNKDCIEETDEFNYPVDPDFQLIQECQNSTPLNQFYYKYYNTPENSSSSDYKQLLNKVFYYIENSLLKSNSGLLVNGYLAEDNGAHYRHPLNFYTWYINKFTKKQDYALELEKKVEELVRLKTIRNDTTDSPKKNSSDSQSRFAIISEKRFQINDKSLNKKISDISGKINEQYDQFWELSVHSEKDYDFEKWSLDDLYDLRRYQLNFTGHTERQLAERLESAQIIFASYLIEARFFGIYVLLTIGIVLALITYLMFKEQSQTFSSFANTKSGYVLNISIIVALLLLIPLLRPVKPNWIDPTSKFWMMSLKDWNLPPFERKEFYPLDILKEDKKKREGEIIYTELPEITVKLKLEEPVEINSESWNNLFKTIIDTTRNRIKTKQINE